VYYTYGAAGRTFTTRPVEDNTAVGITPDLYPGIYSRIADGAEKGWSFTATPLPAVAADVVNVPAVTATRQDTESCGTPMSGTTAAPSCTETERVDFAKSTIATGPSAGKQTPRGGIPIYAEDRINGALVRQFIVQSFQLTPGVAIVTPTAPAGVATPATVVNGLPVVAATRSTASSTTSSVVPVQATPAR
jgi:hypothetical protein